MGRVRRFRKKKFFASKRNEAKRDPFRMRFARSREKKTFFRFFSLHFASNFSFPTKAKLIERIFAMFCLNNFFVSLPIFSFRFNAKRNKRFFALFSLNFIFVSLQMRKQAKKTLFSHRSENILLPFRFEAKMMTFFRFCFASKRK
jgi:hypothetical protein